MGRERSHQLHRSLFMGVLADALRENLRQLAQSDARRLRELDQILKESRAIDDKIKKLKWFTGPSSRGVFFCQFVPGDGSRPITCPVFVKGSRTWLMTCRPKTYRFQAPRRCNKKPPIKGARWLKDKGGWKRNPKGVKQKHGCFFLIVSSLI